MKNNIKFLLSVILWLGLSSVPDLATAASTAIVQSTYLGGWAPKTLAPKFSNNVAAGDLILVMAVGGGSDTITVTDSGSNIYNKIGPGMTQANGHALSFWAKNTGGAGTKVTVTCHFSAHNTKELCAILDISGASSSPIDTYNYSSFGGSSKASTKSFTTAKNGDLLIGQIYDANGGQKANFTAGSGFTMNTAGQIYSGNDYFANEYSNSAASGPQTVSFNNVFSNGQSTGPIFGVGIVSSGIQQTETLTVSAGSNGTISPTGTVTVNSGASQTFTLTPTLGYNANLTVDGSPVTLTNNTYTLSDITANHTIAAIFAITPVNGICGSANGIAVSSAPTTNLCSIGTASSTSGSGPFNWTCSGSNGGTNASCSAPLLTPPAVNGTCGSANGVAVSSAPTTNLCSIGTASSTSGSGPFNWTCSGSNGGTNASCSAPLLTPPAVNGTCGSANGVAVSSAPTTNLCSIGTASSTSGSGPFNWTCSGSNGGTNASCSAPLAGAYILDDEFNSTSVDTNVWAVLNRPGDSSNSEVQYYLPGNVVENNGNLTITSKADTSVSGYNYTSGYLQTKSFNFLYGTVEVRAKTSGGKGTWPTVWLLGYNCQQTNITSADNVPPCNWPQPGSDEIDIFEFLASDFTSDWQSVHTSGFNSGYSTSTKVTDASQNWHTYTLVWAPGSLIWKVDGVTTRTLNQYVPNTPMFLIINTAMGGAGGTVQSSTLPQTMSVDYIRVSPLTTPPPPVNGVCGSANGVESGTMPGSNLCSTGTSSSVTETGNTTWNWNCAGTNGGSTAACTAPVQPVAVNGVCGSANGTAVSSTPTTNLCSTGAATSVTGSGPWSWNCLGTSGGSNASCSATVGTQQALLPPDRDASANWKMAGMLSVGGIPNRTTVCATVSPKGGGADDTANIQNAINACPAGQVVNLSAGIFTIAEGNYVALNKGITLRGAGPGVTTLQRTNGAKLNSYIPGSNPSPMIVVGNNNVGNDGSTTLTVDAAAGKNSVQVASTAGFSVGQIVLLDEASGAGWQPDVVWTNMKIWASSDYRVVYQKHNPFYQYVDDFDASTYPYTNSSAGCWFSNCDRPTNEMKHISAISGNTITFDSPFTISYRVGHQAKLYYSNAPFTQNAGVENMTLSGGDNGNLRFIGAAYCWAENVENTLWLNDGFDLINSFRVQLEGVYVHNAVWPVNGGGGYAISFSWGSSEILIENSISVQANKVMVARSSGAGSVVGYNYMDDGYINGSDGWVEVGLNGSHMVGGHHMLFEGNYSFNTDSDQTHGNSIYHTFFRNYLSGFRKPFTALDGTKIDDTTGCCGPLRTAGAHAYAYWFSYLGNVLGTPGKMNGWVYDAIGGTNYIPSQGIWMLGWVDITPQGYDPNVAATAIRDGNYDYLTNTVVWASNDTAHTLPDSLYLSQEPAFFNSGSGYTWPWVDSVNGKVNTLPAKARYDAGTPFKQP